MTMSETLYANPTDDIVRATLRGRLCIATLTLCLIALIAFYQWFVFPLLSNTLVANPTAQNIRLLKWILGGCAASALLPALCVIVIGWKVRRSGQFPLVDAWVLRDTKIKRGLEAARIGTFCIVSGVITALLCVGAMAYIWIMFERLPSAHTLPQGVILLKQTPGTKP